MLLFSLFKPPFKIKRTTVRKESKKKILMLLIEGKRIAGWAIEKKAKNRQRTFTKRMAY